jgi:hypothetical protein
LACVAALFFVAAGPCLAGGAFDAARAAAEQGNASAQNNLGLMYNNGRGVPQDDAETVDVAADQDLERAEFALGLGLRIAKTGNHAEAVVYYLLSAELGLAEAKVMLGASYRDGEGVPQDYSKAMKWFRLAADQGNSSGQYFLGIMYNNGEGVPQDHAEAVRWYLLAAEQKLPSAFNNLGTSYASGQGVPQDNIIAHMWYNLAVSHGNLTAQRNRELVAKRLTHEQILKAQQLAVEWRPNAK